MRNNITCLICFSNNKVFDVFTSDKLCSNDMIAIGSFV